MSTPIAVQAALLRAALPDLLLREGMTLGARVIERKGDLGLLLLAGAPVLAELPEHLAEGQALRLRVVQTGSDKVVLQVVPEPGEPGSAASAPAAATSAQPAPGAPATAATPAAAYALALPGGATARLLTDPDGGAEDGAAGPARTGGVMLRYDSPRLGRMDLRLDSAGCTIHVSAGEPALEVADAAPALQMALGEVLGRPVPVLVHARGAALDVRT